MFPSVLRYSDEQGLTPDCTASHIHDTLEKKHWIQEEINREVSRGVMPVHMEDTGMSPT
jgi:hypothetical protein